MLLWWCFHSPSTSHHLHGQIPDPECFVAARGVAEGRGVANGAAALGGGVQGAAK